MSPQSIRPVVCALLACLVVDQVAWTDDASPAKPAAPTVGGKPPPAKASDVKSAAVVELPLADGKSLTGVVESIDSKEVVLRIGEDRRPIAWEQLTPLGVFRAHAALAAPDEGPARLSLAELAADLGLFVDARREYEKALGLHALDALAYQKAIAAAEERAVNTLLAQAERAADQGDPDKALEALRRVQIDFGNAVDPRRVAALLAAVAAKVDARGAEQLKLEAEMAKLSEESRRKKEILVRMTEAKRDRALGDKAADEARSYMPKGVVSRVRRSADEADDFYGTARRDLGRLRHVVGKSGPDRDAWALALDELDKVQFTLLLEATKFFWDARVYGTAEDFATRASYIDPVNPALLELRSDIRANRIRYRASDITNAHPTTR